MRGAVLIADDLRLFLEIEKSFLVRAGFEVLTAETGERAVELAHKRRTHLILLDLNMPGMNGVEACAAMRREPTLAFTPIIIMSATGSPEIRERCLRAGCTEFVVKPEKPEELLGVVERVLAGRRRKMTRMTVVFSMADSPEGRQIVGRAMDLSGTGLLLVSSKPIRAGAVLELEFVVPRNHHAVRVKGEVTRSNQNADGDFEAGIHFVEISPSDQESILDDVFS